jgi:hypothetical protein
MEHDLKIIPNILVHGYLGALLFKYHINEDARSLDD